MAEEQKQEEIKNEAAPAAAVAPAGTEKPKEAEKPCGKAARPTNCVVCNKSIKKTRWYYRNGKNYCTKTCWQAAIKKDKDAAAAAAEAAAQATAQAAAAAAAEAAKPAAPAEGTAPAA